MKARSIRFAALVTTVLLSTLTANAQRTFLRANVPFEFVAGGVHLPPGEYRVYHPGNPYIVIIENKNATARAMTYVHVSAVKPSTNSTKLLFNRYGDQYFLAEIWTERDWEVHQCFRCGLERAVMAQSRKPTTVVVAATH